MLSSGWRCLEVLQLPAFLVKSDLLQIGALTTRECPSVNGQVGWITRGMGERGRVMNEVGSLSMACQQPFSF
jgi:hypothetical protein